MPRNTVVLDQAIRQALAECADLAVPLNRLVDYSDLFRAGMTSHGGVAVMLKLEQTFGFEFPDTMLRKSTFTSIASIRAALVQLSV